MNRDLLGKWAEILAPWVAAFLAASSAFFVDYPRFLASDSAGKLLDKMVDICAIGIGFWATAATLLLALEGRETVQGLKKLGTYNRIVGYFLNSIYSLFVLLAFSLVTIAAGRPCWFPQRPYASLWLFLVVLSAASMLRSFRLLGKLLRAR